MDFLQLSIEIITKATISLREATLNERQCKNLLQNFSRGVERIQSIIGRSCTNVFDGAKKDLFQIIYKARALIEECCKEDWLKIVVLQIDNKKTFRELLVDFKCCCDTICNISQYYYSTQIKEIIEIKRSTKFFPTCIDEVDQDLLSLLQMLNGILLHQLLGSEDMKLAHYLIGRIRDIEKAKGGGLDIIILLDEYPLLEYRRPPILLSRKRQGGVAIYSTKWLDLESANKVTPIVDLSKEYTKEILKEVGILGGLSHSNIIKFFCCGFSKKKKKNLNMLWKKER
uniref:Protein kinase domain-containing protein n=1 Tax=Physcomitrium patens TaxID=3218 RepID=A0A2K1JXG8_PHYPA|nr:hypothetical protein PHYPA_013345 [Physcomitrium patens]